MGNSAIPVLPTDISLKELPEAFCKFFSDKIKDIRCELDSCPIDNDFIPFDGIPLTCFRPVSEETVRDRVLKSPTKSCALDPIPTGFLKACIDSLVPLVTHIVNESLESGTVRDVLKQAIVILLLKQPSLDSNMLKNYRPVSNLPFISLTQLQEHLSENGLLETCQSAYRKEHSTETALLAVTDNLLSNTDNRFASIVTFLDLCCV